ncbi:MAG: hypothetical protein HY782_23690 [Chloroflexi bacterium]|nr:hypothetical protein [Chloroflexota bacterium]
MLSKNVLYYGTDEPPPERISLRAGALSLQYEQGDLWYVKLGDRELWRRVYVAIRDQDWGTVPPVFSNVQIHRKLESFAIHYQVENRQNEIHFAWKGLITGDADGTITFSMDGVARSTFMRSRIGFCLLHPLTCAGAPCRIEHIDGTVERAVLPEYIVQEQPVRPFAEMSALAHEAMPGMWAKARFAGDVFEMEDQRNWTDASYKTYCTPAHLPHPVLIMEGTRVQQSVTLRVEDGKSESRPRVRRENAPLALKLDLTSAKPLPWLGLGMASHGQPLSDKEITRLKALRLHHLRVDLVLADRGWRTALERATAEAFALGFVLEAALLVPEKGEPELEQFRAVLDQIKPPIGTWLVYPSREREEGGSPTAQVVALARHFLANYNPAARFGSGTNADLLFLLRNPPPVEQLDLICIAANPQVHASDNVSLVETPQAQPIALASARRLAGGLPLAVSPITFKPRFNPYALGPEPVAPAGELPPQVDVRQMSLLGAAWTAASISFLGASGAHSITYYETTGWRGVMETRTGSPAPKRFPSLPGAVFPLYHVLADVGEFAGGEIIPAHSEDPLRVTSLAIRKNNNLRIILANMTGSSQRVALPHTGPTARVKMLDEFNAEAAMLSPETWRAQPGAPLRAQAAIRELALPPFAIARIDTDD